MMDASVRLVRSRLRPRLAHSNGRYLNMVSPFTLPGFAAELPLIQMQHMLGARRGVRIVRHHDDGLALLLIQRLQQIEDLIARLAVEVAGRLVAQQQRRIGNDRARDADALLLTAGQLARLVLGAFAQSHQAQRCAGALATIRGRQRGQQQRQFDVALGGQHRQQVVHLEHEADVIRAPAAELAVAHRVGALAGDFDRARGRPVEAADQVQQRRLAGARRAHQRQEIPFGDVQVERVQDMHGFRASLVILRHAPQSYQSLHDSPRVITPLSS